MKLTLGKKIALTLGIGAAVISGVSAINIATVDVGFERFSLIADLSDQDLKVTSRDGQTVVSSDGIAEKMKEIAERATNR